MSTRAWVLGRGGLLGSNVARALGQVGPGVALRDINPGEHGTPGQQTTPGQQRTSGEHTPGQQGARTWSWTDLPAFASEIERATADFARDAAGAPWIIVWAAGASFIGSPPELLARDVELLRALLAALSASGLATGAGPGLIVLASSAGGVYGHSPDTLISESSPCRPASEYGSSRLAMEAALAAWSATAPRVSTLIARISNLYGPRQNFAKRQGLISHLVRSVIYNRPVNMFVPLDTIRDFLYAPDCAARLTACIERWAARAHEPAVHVQKIFASEQTTTVGQVIHHIARLARRPLRVLTRATAATVQQVAVLRFRSEVWRELDRCQYTELKVGLARVYRDLLRRYREGHLASPD